MEPGGCDPPCPSCLTLSVALPSCAGPVFLTSMARVLFMCMQAGGTDWTWLSRYGSDSCASVLITAFLSLSLSLSLSFTRTHAHVHACIHATRQAHITTRSLEKESKIKVSTVQVMATSKPSLSLPQRGLPRQASRSIICRWMRVLALSFFQWARQLAQT